MVVKKGDTVVVISGNYKGKQGTVLKVITKDNRVVVKGVNVVSRHTRPSQANPDGGIIKKEAPIDASNVMLVDPKTNKGTEGCQAIQAGRHQNRPDRDRFFPLDTAGRLEVRQNVLAGSEGHGGRTPLHGYPGHCIHMAERGPEKRKFRSHDGTRAADPYGTRRSPDL